MIALGLQHIFSISKIFFLFLHENVRNMRKYTSMQSDHSLCCPHEKKNFAIQNVPSEDSVQTSQVNRQFKLSLGPNV